jgi:hypothetical protein
VKPSAGVVPPATGPAVAAKPSAGVVPPATGPAVAAKPPTGVVPLATGPADDVKNNNGVGCVSMALLPVKIPGEIQLLKQSSTSMSKCLLEGTEDTGGSVDIQRGNVIALNDDCSLVSSSALIIHNFEKFARVEVLESTCLSFFYALRYGLGLKVPDILQKFEDLKNVASQDVVDSIKKLETRMNVEQANIYVSDNICKSFNF